MFDMETTSEDEKLMFIHKCYSEDADIAIFWSEVLEWWRAQFQWLSLALTKSKCD